MRLSKKHITKHLHKILDLNRSRLETIDVVSVNKDGEKWYESYKIEFLGEGPKPTHCELRIRFKVPFFVTNFNKQVEECKR